MKVEIGAEAALFPEKEYRKGIFVAVYYELVIECAIAVYAVYGYFLLFGPSFELAP
jgi:hypothetical protein